MNVEARNKNQAIPSASTGGCLGRGCLSSRNGEHEARDGWAALLEVAACKHGAVGGGLCNACEMRRGRRAWARWEWRP